MSAIVTRSGRRKFLDAAYDLGLCCQCFHTRECCGGTCWTLDVDFDPWDHVCVDTKAQSLAQIQNKARPLSQSQKFRGRRRRNVGLQSLVKRYWERVSKQAANDGEATQATKGTGI